MANGQKSSNALSKPRSAGPLTRSRTRKDLLPISREERLAGVGEGFIIISDEQAEEEEQIVLSTIPEEVQMEGDEECEGECEEEARVANTSNKRRWSTSGDEEEPRHSYERPNTASSAKKRARVSSLNTIFESQERVETSLNRFSKRFSRLESMVHGINDTNRKIRHDVQQMVRQTDDAKLASHSYQSRIAKLERRYRRLKKQMNSLNRGTNEEEAVKEEKQETVDDVPAQGAIPSNTAGPSGQANDDTLSRGGDYTREVPATPVRHRYRSPPPRISRRYRQSSIRGELGGIPSPTILTSGIDPFQVVHVGEGSAERHPFTFKSPRRRYDPTVTWYDQQANLANSGRYDSDYDLPSRPRTFRRTATPFPHQRPYQLDEALDDPRWTRYREAELQGSDSGVVERPVIPGGISPGSAVNTRGSDRPGWYDEWVDVAPEPASQVISSTQATQGSPPFIPRSPDEEEIATYVREHRHRSPTPPARRSSTPTFVISGGYTLGRVGSPETFRRPESS